MVLSRDADLESWRFLSARLEGGAHDGDIATWVLPGVSGEDPPQEVIPPNEAAVDPGRSPSRLEPADYEVCDWMLLGGAVISQWCVEALGG